MGYLSGSDAEDAAGTQHWTLLPFRKEAHGLHLTLPLFEAEWLIIINKTELMLIVNVLIDRRC